MFAKRMVERAQEIDSRVIIGLDPDLSKMPPEVQKEAQENGVGLSSVIGSYLRQVIEATRQHAVAFKPQAAFYEQFQRDGLEVLEYVIESLRELGQIVILDAKRNDIGNTAAAYGRAWLNSRSTHGFPNPWMVDAITVAPYMGKDSVLPFLDANRDAGVSLLCRTSNSGADDFQDFSDNMGGCLYERVAEKAHDWGKDYRPLHCKYSNLGLVVGATKDIREVRSIRQFNKRALFLMPGIGVQGGSIETIVAGAGPDLLGAYAAASRSVLYPKRRTKEEQALWDGENWPEFIRLRCEEEARLLKEAIQKRFALERWRNNLKSKDIVVHNGQQEVLEGVYTSQDTLMGRIRKSGAKVINVPVSEFNPVSQG